ncbi:dethiobiotin synthase [Jatrophihabitans sp.]|uniref:dethiobiotin synthase n=1 Tax=Jatrophihabitans sp. TaxID=1932789 RepID=UPI002C17F722|nr:dethiobiotin synthase [Jatrophihabitans sp.]
MRFIAVTGTGTGVGKTVTTAALASCALRAGQRVAVVKPVQTGVRPGEPGDLAEVRRLTGLDDLHEYVRYAEPLAPATAARRLGDPGPALDELAGRIAGLADRDLVIVEGAGGALVRFNDRDEGMAELIGAVQELVRSPSGDGRSPRVEVVLVTGANLGCLHHAAATARALEEWGLAPGHLVVGDWPAEPGLAERCNLQDLPSYGGAPLRGVLPSGAGRLLPEAFAEVAVRSLTPALGGSFDAVSFVRRHAAPEPMRVSSP